jgi:hypothetical protein
MRSWQKVMVSCVTVVLTVPVAVVLYGYSTGTCSDYDPCPTGEALPYATYAMIGSITFLLLQAAFLIMIWKRRSSLDVET